jgi:hypothetical protein
MTINFLIAIVTAFVALHLLGLAFQGESEQLELKTKIVN